MNIPKELSTLAQEIDDLGLTKQADALDEVVSFLVKESSDVEFDLLYQMVSYLITEKNISPEEALVRAAKELDDLTGEAESFSPTDEERARAKELIPLQMMNMFPTDENSEH